MLVTFDAVLMMHLCVPLRNVMKNIWKKQANDEMLGKKDQFSKNIQFLYPSLFIDISLLFSIFPFISLSLSLSLSLSSFSLSLYLSLSLSLPLSLSLSLSFSLSLYLSLSLSLSLSISCNDMRLTSGVANSNTNQDWLYNLL